MNDRFLLVDKDGGWTSHDVVAKVRRITGIRKVGHAGTLDPMATGLLVVAIGRTTRLLRFVQDLPKTYEATAVMGVATDTLDADGAVLSREPMPVSEDDVVGVLPRFLGTVLQVPPMVSALKVDGRRLYELAREGKEVEREPRRIEIHSIELLDFSPCDYPEMVFRVECGKGTYVRSLADDIASALGGRAHLSALRRTHIGELSVDDAITIEGLEAAGPNWEAATLSPAAVLAHLPTVRADADVATGVRHGTPFSAAAFGEPGVNPYFSVVDEHGEFLAVYRSDGRKARAEVVFG